ncbi:MAG: diiron oxygenase [Jatrophihabitans sp.]|nr:MAG: diiron oxygenase [Jatrophihabitans sp.]
MTAAVNDREKTAIRLLNSSSRNSYDPLLDIDWDAEVPDDKAYMPYERVSLYGTKLWGEMSEEQRRELSKHEIASIASTGLWFAIILIQMLARYAYHQDPLDPHTHYALTEIGDETRHVVMFAKAISRMGVPAYRPPALVFQLARIYKAAARGPVLFAPVLVAEEVTDRIQRAIMNDESMQPLIRMVNRIHVVEEARHVRFAREEIARQMAGQNAVEKLINTTVAAVVSAFVVSVLISPKVYEAVGLDPRRAVREARRNPHYRQTRRWLGEKIMSFLDEQGMITWNAKPIYRLVSLV